MPTSLLGTNANPQLKGPMGSYNISVHQMKYVNGILDGIIGINKVYYKVKSGENPVVLQPGNIYGFKPPVEGGAITLRNRSSSRKTARKHFSNMLDELMIEKVPPL